MTTVNAQVRSSHEAAGITDKEDGSTTELRRITDAAKHVLAGPLGLALGVDVEEVLEHLGLDVSGGEGVDTNAVLTPLGGQAARELEDGGLGGVVDTTFVSKWVQSRCECNTYGANMPRLAMVPLILAIMAMEPGWLRRTIWRAAA